MSDPKDTGRPDDEARDGAARDDVEIGLRFVHLMGAQTRAQVSELTASLQAIAEILVAEGHLPLEAYQARRRLTMAREEERAAGDAAVIVSDVADKYALDDLPVIDCAERLPLCRARCCSLPVALSVQDLDERALRWDYGRPYLLARGAHGGCAHLGDDGACTVYAQRPAACRVYDCSRDRRIWIDFEKRVPAP